MASLPDKNIIFVGDPGVGKSHFIRSYVSTVLQGAENFQGPYLGFNQDHVLFPLRGGRHVNIRLLDPIVSADKLKGKQYPQEMKLVVMCFAVNDFESFRNIALVWYRDIRSTYPLPRCCLLGLKTDARPEMTANGGVYVTVDQANEMHRLLELCGRYMECSTLQNPEEAHLCMQRIISESFMFDAFHFN